MSPIFCILTVTVALLLSLAMAGAGATTDEAKVPPYTLPNPLMCEDGTAVADRETWWNKRRPELLRLFENEVYGKTPIGRPEQLRFVVREELKQARGGKATRLRVAVLFEGTEEGRQMELLVYLPNQVAGPAPLFLGLNFDGNYTTTIEPDLPLPDHYAMGLFSNRLKDNQPTESSRGIHQHLWPYAYALERGYAVATAAYGDVEPDADGRWREGPRGLGPEPGADDWGCIGGWAWALSRAMDYLETDERVDANRVALIGFSRLGKTALWAAAQDQRFAMVVSNQSGAGGAALSKRLFGEDVEHLTGPLGRWFAPNFRKYANNEAALPVDQHQLLALIAPRPVLITSATTDLWSDPKGEFLAGRAASPVFELLGTDGLTTREWPAPSKLIDSTLGYFLRPGAHDVTLEDWQAMIAFADKHLR